MNGNKQFVREPETSSSSSASTSSPSSLTPPSPLAHCSSFISPFTASEQSFHIELWQRLLQYNFSRVDRQRRRQKRRRRRRQRRRRRRLSSSFAPKGGWINNVGECASVCGVSVSATGVCFVNRVWQKTRYLSMPILRVTHTYTHTHTWIQNDFQFKLGYCCVCPWKKNTTKRRDATR